MAHPAKENYTYLSLCLFIISLHSYQTNPLSESSASDKPGSSFVLPSSHTGSSCRVEPQASSTPGNVTDAETLRLVLLVGGQQQSHFKDCYTPALRALHLS
ncbi:hypothetical protein AB205_0141340 [Aquarana catesbeiana]|uniref:Uncharacterized protein n=1 Tax=Aquarana catesbeiana TaxID=8400 RepID=A0A2G9SJZ8_AQUCT|nr:hypothetical protein AB205_0141340 [Aquarana catesbeiana]